MLVLLFRAMRRPLAAGRATIRILRFFCLSWPYWDSRAILILAMVKGKRKKIGKWLRQIPSLGHYSSKDTNFEDTVSNNNSRLTQCNSNNIFLPSSKALIYASEIDFIAKCIQDYPILETGGQLYGAWTASGAPRVIYAIGPGPNANHECAYFNQDIAYLEAVGAKLKQYGLQHIGEWHSHHHLGIPRPSGHDASTMQNGIDQLNLHRLLLCIGSFDSKDEIVIKPFNFARDAQYNDASWEIINTDNRLRQLIDADLKGLLIPPQAINYTVAEPHISALQDPMLGNNGWFSVKENRIVLKRIIDTLKDQRWVMDVTPQIGIDGIITLKVQSNNFVEVVTFPKDFPDSPFSIEHMNLIEGHCYNDYPQVWEIIGNDLFKTFITNYKNHLQKITK